MEGKEEFLADHHTKAEKSMATNTGQEPMVTNAGNPNSEHLPSSMDMSDSTQEKKQRSSFQGQELPLLRTDSEPGNLPTSPLQSNSDLILTLEQLPSEIILHICSFIDARFVLATLSRVCHFFHDLLNDRVFWKVRLRRRWPKKYPAIPVNDAKFNWKAACIQREEQVRLWSQPEHSMDFFRFTEGIFAPVDCVHMMQNAKLLAIGSRDRYLNVLDLGRLDADDPNTSLKNSRVFTKMDAHKGWIWSLASLDGLLATGSWDTYIKFWDLELGGQEVRNVKCKSAVLAMHYEPQFLVAGGFDKKVYHIDPRAATVLAEKRYHKQSVLCLTADDDYIVTGSEDSTVVVYDRRADKVLRTLKFANFPMCMSYDVDQLWIGDKEGLVHLVDATDGDFDVVETYNVGHRGKITGIQHTLGALYTCSTDRTICVHEPGANPSLITTLSTQKAEVASIHFRNNILVSGCSDVSVGIWMPRRKVEW